MLSLLACFTVMKRICTLPVSVSIASAIFLGMPATAGANTVPSEYVPWLQASAAQCSGISPALLAAQIHVESGFDVNAVSYAGARGPSQFMPGTWSEWGVDADGDGVASITSVPDAVTAQGSFMCYLLQQTTAGVANGTLSGDPLNLALAGYNAGLGAVRNAGGMPSGGTYSTQTQPYVSNIRALEPSYAWVGQGTAAPLPTLPDLRTQVGADTWDIFGSLS
jgi:hypothetical protein